MQFLDKIPKIIPVSEFAKNQIELIQTKIPSEELVEEVNSNLLRIIEALKYYSAADLLSKYFINLLQNGMDKRTYSLQHPSHLEVLKCLNIDEIEILEKLKAKNFQFVRKADLVDHKFTNYEWIKFEFPKEELSNPDSFFDGEHFLRERFQLTQWPIYNQDPIVEDKKQTGIMLYSELHLTRFGVNFINNISPDETTI